MNVTLSYISWAGGMDGTEIFLVVVFFAGQERFFDVKSVLVFGFEAVRITFIVCPCLVNVGFLYLDFYDNQIQIIPH